MIRSITVINYLGDSLTLDLTRPEDSGFVVRSITGIGPGTATINSTEITTDDGGLINLSRLPARNIVISLYYYWKDVSSVETLRHLSYRYFPVKKDLTLIFETDERKLKIEGRVESNDPDIFSSYEGTDISIICPYPYFYSLADDDQSVTSLSDIEDAFEFPFSNESLNSNLIEFSYIQARTEAVITYFGDTEIGMTINIHAIGEVGTITIYNTGTREEMIIDNDKIAQLTGSGIMAGDTIIICTLKRQKSITLVRGGESINILNCLAKGSTWFQLTRGDNTFAYIAEYGETNLQFVIENDVIYEGV